jgi:hypothetical protein
MAAEAMNASDDGGLARQLLKQGACSEVASALELWARVFERDRPH